MSEVLDEQINEIVMAIESEGLGYALSNGYIQPDTEDEALNASIEKAIEGIGEIESKIEPYRL